MSMEAGPDTPPRGRKGKASPETRGQHTLGSITRYSHFPLLGSRATIRGSSPAGPHPRPVTACSLGRGGATWLREPGQGSGPSGLL